LAYSHRVPVEATRIGAAEDLREIALCEGGRSVTRNARVSPSQIS
jgi:hypothetical protein